MTDTYPVAGLPAASINREPLAVRLIKRPFMMLAATVMFAAAAAACSPDQEEPATTVTTPTVHKVVYDAEGTDTKTASYTLRSQDGGTRQGDVDLPLRNKAGAIGLTFEGFKPGDFVYLSVQNKNSYGSVTCRITVDRNIISENTSHGGYKIATCSGKVP